MPTPHPLEDGDSTFVGVNNKLDPSLLPPGFVSDGQNVRFSSGVIEPRKGIKKIGFGNLANTKISSNGGTENYTSDGTTFDITGERIVNQGFTNYDQIQGIGKFQDPTGFNWLLVATATKVYAVRDGNPRREIKKGNTSVANSKTVEFVQCFNTVIMFRGEGVSPLVMTDIETGWKDIEQTDSDTDIPENESDGTEKIPSSTTGLFFQNRLLVPHERDLVAVSDYLNYTRYQPVMANFRINQGSEDKLVALRKYDENTVLCFKEASVYAVRNLIGNLQDAYLDEITSDYGLASAKAVTTVGRDVWFLSDQRGVVSLSLSQSGKLQGVDVPVSDPIQGYIDRINWSFADKAASTYHKNKYYLAVPLDSNTSNSAILVYDFKNQAWSGIDVGDELEGLLDFVTYKFQGAKRLFFATNELVTTNPNTSPATKAWSGFLNLYDDSFFCGSFDEKVTLTSSVPFVPVASGRNVSFLDIVSSVTSRGYKCGLEARKIFKAAELNVATNGVVSRTGLTNGVSASAIFDGVEETTSFPSVSNKTFSRTKYSRPFDKADYVTTNAGDDYLTPYREDYSLWIDGSDTIDPGSNGVDPDAFQHSLLKESFINEGKYCQLKLINNVGRCKVAGFSVAATPAENTFNVKR